LKNNPHPTLSQRERERKKLPEGEGKE